MALGRCAGCGRTGSCKKVEVHALTCPQYLELFRTQPERCLDPAAEHDRHKEQNTSEARAAQRDIRLRARFAEMERQQNIQGQRWRKPKDILDD